MMGTDKIGTFPAERVLVGVSGSIAALAVAPGILWMRQTLGISSIRVIMTPQAATLIPPSTMAAVSGNKVLVLWKDAEDYDISHLTITKWADIFVVMPATANIMAKATYGIADDLLSTTILAAECPVVFAPGMNEAMWKKPATQRNVTQLEADGYTVIRPVRGSAVVDGLENAAAMADLPTVMGQVRKLLSRSHLHDRGLQRDRDSQS